MAIDGRQQELRDEHVHPLAEPGPEVDDVAAVPRDDVGHRGDDARSVGAVDVQRVGGSGNAGVAVLGERPDVDGEVTGLGERPQRRRDLVERPLAADQDDHREMSAQQRHRGVLEVAPEPGERRRHVGDDARPVVPEHGHGDEARGGRHRPTLTTRVGRSRRRRLSGMLTPSPPHRRSRTASSIGSVSLPVKVFCWLTW